MRKKNLKIALILISIFLVPSFIYASGNSQDTGSANAGLDGNAANVNNGYSNGATTNGCPATGCPDGMKLCFNDSSGKQIGDCLDYIADSDYNGNANIFMPANNCGKVGYASSSDDCTFSASGVQQGTVGGNINKASELEDVFDELDINFDINVNQAIENNNYTDILKNLNYEELKDKNPNLTPEEYNKAVSSVFETLLGEAGADSLESYKDPETGAYDIFLNVEPTTIVTIGGKQYYVTSYEMAQIAAANPTSGVFSACKNAKDANCDIYVVQQEMLCTAFVEGTFEEQMQGNALVGSFSGGTYYDGAISVPTGDVVNKVCSKNSLGNIQFDPSNGLALGSVWLGGILAIGDPDNPTILSCDTIFTKYPHLKGYTDRDKFINDFSSGITFDNNNIAAGLFFDSCLVSKKPVDKEYNCTPLVQVGSCDGSAIIYKDSSQGIVNDEYWENCIFSNAGNEYKTADDYLEKELGFERYCKVYCIEDVETTFFTINKNYQPVEAGRYIVLNNGTLRESRTCRTDTKVSKVKYSTFETDLETAMNNSNKYYKEYVKHINMSLNKKEVANQCYDWEFADFDDGCSDGYTSVSCNDYDSDGNCVEVLCQSNHSYSATYIKGGTVNYSDNKNGGGSISWQSAQWCNGGEFYPGDKGEEVELNPDKYYQQYLENKQLQFDWIEGMKTCYQASKFPSGVLLNFNTSASLEYKNLDYYYKNALGIPTGGEAPIGGHNCEKEEEWKLVNCSGTGPVDCEFKKEVMYNCTKGDEPKVEYKGQLSGVITVNPNSYQYIDKNGSLSFNAGTTSPNANLNFSTNFVDMGFGNLPVAYRTPSGTYSRSTTPIEGYLDAVATGSYLKLGYNDGEPTTVDKILEQVYSEAGKDYVNSPWECEYTVINNLLCDPNDNSCYTKGDINLIFRPIDLNDPFPDINADGRETGSNWCTYGDCSNNNGVVDYYITNNRGVSTNDVYNEEPMYTFVLTPATIKEIRKYNNKNDYNSYTGSIGNQNYDYKCETGTGNACISNYLSHIIDITNAKDYPGTCVADNTRTYNDREAFENCRYKK